MRDCVVVGIERDGNAEALRRAASARLVAQSRADAAEIVERANARLAPFQQMRHWMVWPESGFPAHANAKAVAGADPRVPPRSAFGPASRLRSGRGHARSARASRSCSSAMAGGLRVRDAAAKLQLSSIERVELLSALEDRYQVDLSETEFANADTVRAHRALLEQPETHARRLSLSALGAKLAGADLSRAVFNLLARPAMLLLGWPRIRGRENLARSEGSGAGRRQSHRIFRSRLHAGSFAASGFAADWPWPWMASFSNRCAIPRRARLLSRRSLIAPLIGWWFRSTTFSRCRCAPDFAKALRLPAI